MATRRSPTLSHNEYLAWMLREVFEYTWQEIASAMGVRSHGMIIYWYGCAHNKMVDFCDNPNHVRSLVAPGPADCAQNGKRPGT